MNFLPQLWNYIKKTSLVLALITAVITGGWVANLYEISRKPQIPDKQSIVEGDNALNIGRYSDAKRIFDAEFKANPENRQAAWNMEVARVRETIASPDFKEDIDALYQKNPGDSHVNLFMGDFYAADNQPEMAVTYYEQAIKLNPKLAEAHYDLAMLYEQQNNLVLAKVESMKALEISPTPKYRNNLGTIYFKQRRYEEAIREFARNQEYPLSALESAKIYWRLEYLSQAVSYQKQAVEWLEDKIIMDKPDNQETWYFETAFGKVIQLVELEEKKSYALFCLSVSLYFQGDKQGAENEVKKIYDLKVTRQADINALLTADLDTLVQANDTYADQVAAFKELYL
jgi:tetratricopeptide (TPR) repeat protein